MDAHITPLSMTRGRRSSVVIEERFRRLSPVSLSAGAALTKLPHSRGEGATFGGCWWQVV